MATGGAKTTAGPSVMGPAGHHDGSLHTEQTQTAAGRPSRPDNHVAKEEELDLTKMLTVKQDARERMAAAMALVDGVILLAEERRGSLRQSDPQTELVWL